MRVGRVLGLDTGPVLERYRSIQIALGHAIRAVHPNRSDVPNVALKAIRSAIVEYEWIFTTNYDLILYWAMGSDGWKPFVDTFKYGGRCEFDPRRADISANEVPVYFLHGALHLVAGGSGTTWKLRNTYLQTLLDQFGQPIDGDSEARPLLVTEGSAAEKLRAIEGNDYLAHALQRLRDVDLPIVVFGSSLSTQDDHLIDALNEQPSRPVAVSMLPRRRSLGFMPRSRGASRMATKRYVKQNAHGRWEVLEEGHRRAPVHYETRQKALTRARELARREGGGEIRVMNTMGKVEDAVTVPKSGTRVKGAKRAA